MTAFTHAVQSLRAAVLRSVEVPGGATGDAGAEELRGVPIVCKACGRLGRRAFALLLSLSLVTGPAGMSLAEVPRRLHYRGSLADNLGRPVTGAHSFRAKLYSASTGGSLLYTEDFAGGDAASVYNGIYELEIGSVTGTVPASVFDGDQLWLELDVKAGTSLAGAETLLPRQRLASEAYAFHARTAEYLGTGAFITTHTATGDLQVPGTVTAAAFSGDGAALTNVPPTGAAGGDLTGNYPNPTIAASAVATAEILNNTITMTDVANALTLDAATSLALANLDLTVNLSGTGDFVLQDAGVGLHVFRDDGAVGIGTTAPGTPFQVYGDADTNFLASVKNASAGASAYAHIEAQGDSAATAIVQGSLASGDLGGLFSTASGGLFIAQYHDTAAIGFATGGFTTGQERMRIDSAGRVAVGTTLPSARLHVSSGSAGSSDWVFLASSGTAAGQELLLVRGDGRVGVGTTAPASVLHAIGTVTATDFECSDCLVANDLATSSVGTAEILNNTVSMTDISNALTLDAATSLALANLDLTVNLSGTGDLVLQDAGVGLHIFRDDGLVGIGTTAPTTRLEVSGTVTATAFAGDGAGLANVPPAGAAGGDLSGSYPSPDVVNDSHSHADATLSSIAASKVLAGSFAAGTYDFPGALGIGTASPSGLFQVGGGTLTVTSLGRVGVGTTVPTQALDVLGTVNATDFTCANCINAGDIATSGVATAELLDNTVAMADIANALTLDAATSLDLAALNLTFNLSGTGDFVLQDAGVGTHIFRDDGFVGIGTTNPSQRLHVQGGSLVVDSGGTVGIGTTVPLYSLDVQGNLRSTLDAYLGTGGGNLGVGTTVPAYKVDVVGGDINLQLGRSLLIGGEIVASRTASQVMIGTNLVQDLGLWAGAERVRVATSGNVGIGTTNPSTHRLHVQAGSANLLRLENSVATGNVFLELAQIGGDLGYLSLVDGSPDQLRLVNRNGDASIWTGSGSETEKVRVLAGGNVGIGSASPSQKLDVAGYVNTDSASGYMLGGVLGLNRSAAILQHGNSASITQHSFYSGGSESLRIDNTNRFQLNQVGSAANPAINWGLNGSDTNTGIYRPNNDVLAFATSGVERLLIDSGGNIGIGSGSPGSLLDVGGTSLTAQLQNLSTWGLNARVQGLLIMPEGDVREDGAGNLTIPTVIVMSPLSGSWIRVLAGTYALGSWGALWAPIPPTGARGTTVAPTVLAWTDADRNYDGRDRVLLAQRQSSGPIYTNFGLRANYTSNDGAYFSGAVGIGTTSVPYKTYVYNDDFTWGLVSDSVGTSGQVTGILGESFGSNPSGTNIGVYGWAGSAATNYAFYSSAGNVYFSGNLGVGSLTAASKLDVVGDLSMSGGGAEIRFRNSGGTIEQFVWHSGTSLGLGPGSSTNSIFVTNAGLVGIATNSPTTRLSISGTGSTNGVTWGVGQTTPITMWHDASQPTGSTKTAGFRMTSTGGRFYMGSVEWFEDCGSNRFCMNGDLELGLQSGTTGCLLDADGTTLVGTCSSDARLKTDVRPFEPVLERLARLEPVHFRWKAPAEVPRPEGEGEPYEPKNEGALAFGLIAQEVEKEFPEMVVEDSWGFKAVEYHRLPMLYLEAIRELKQRSDALEKRLRELESRPERGGWGG